MTSSLQPNTIAYNYMLHARQLHSLPLFIYQWPKKVGHNIVCCEYEHHLMCVSLCVWMWFLFARFHSTVWMWVIGIICGIVLIKWQSLTTKSNHAMQCHAMSVSLHLPERYHSLGRMNMILVTDDIITIWFIFAFGRQFLHAAHAQMHNIETCNHNHWAFIYSQL